MRKNIIALLLILAAVLGGVGELCGLLLPVVSWPFTVSRELPFLSTPAEMLPVLAVEGRVHWFGWLCMCLPLLCAAVLLLRRRNSFRPSPVQERRWKRFRSIRRGYWSLLVLMGILCVAAMDQCVVGKRALAVEYGGEWYFPAFCRHVIPGSVFGLQGNRGIAEADYRYLDAHAGEPGFPGTVLMPLIPYAPTMDVAPFPTEKLPMRDGVLYAADGVTPYDGLACRLFPDGELHMRIRYRKGLPAGRVQGWDEERREVYAARYENGDKVEERCRDARGAEAFLALTDKTELHFVHYHPAPPLVGGHLLGTDSRGADIAAYLFGGLQVNIKASLFYLPVIYAIGLTLGMLMGYFCGAFDLFVQRIIEIFSQLPFLFVVMVLSELLPAELRGMFLILGLLSLFGWMHMTYIIRAATMKEKARDYVQSARVMGAGPLRIMVQHILPNLTGSIVTLIPFSIATVILSLASLDYMGFGLPDSYAGWGRLLNDGLSKLSSPWVVSSASGALVITLMLVTFIGEAVREAVAPQRHTYYE